MAPASRRLATNSAVSSLSSRTCYGHAVDAQGRGIGAITKNEIARRGQVAVHVFQIPGDSDFAHGIGKAAVLDPETSGAARIIAGHTVHAHADELRDVEAFA